MSNMRFFFAILGTLLLAGCGDDGGATETVKNPGLEMTAIESAHDACSDTYSPRINVADEGHTLLIEGVFGGEDLKTMRCMFDELGTPTSIRSQMDSTNSLMGRQTADDAGLTYAWSYHPDNGFDLTVTE